MIPRILVCSAILSASFLWIPRKSLSRALTLVSTVDTNWAVFCVNLVSNDAILFSSIFTLLSRVMLAAANFESTACDASVAAASVSVRSVSIADVSESFSSFVDLAMFAVKSSLSNVRAASPASNRAAISATVIDNGGFFWSLVCSSSISARSDFAKSKSPSVLAFLSLVCFALIHGFVHK